ncbi:MAG: hypothetical protein AAGI38_07815 [Bacteroidota bacterium]
MRCLIFLGLALLLLGCNPPEEGKKDSNDLEMTIKFLEFHNQQKLKNLEKLTNDLVPYSMVNNRKNLDRARSIENSVWRIKSSKNPDLEEEAVLKEMSIISQELADEHLFKFKPN